jgi:hypothetical protein
MGTDVCTISDISISILLMFRKRSEESKKIETTSEELNSDRMPRRNRSFSATISKLPFRKSIGNSNAMREGDDPKPKTLKQRISLMRNKGGKTQKDSVSPTNENAPTALEAQGTNKKEHIPSSTSSLISIARNRHKGG